MSLTPKDWSSFQHYKERRPPWIKLHRTILDNADFQRLHVASRALAPMLWLLAAEYENGEITADHADIAWRLRMTVEDFEFALRPLIDKEFFIASEMLADCKRDAMPERETETQEKTEKIAATPKPKSEKASRAKPKVSIPDGYAFPQSVRDYATSKWAFNGSEIDRELVKFIRHAKTNDRRCADWDSAAENWFDKAAEFAGKQPVNNTPAVVAGFYAKFESAEQDAWDDYGKRKSGKTFPRDRDGGWRFPTQWPPGYVSHETKHDPPEIKLQSMSS